MITSVCALTFGDVHAESVTPWQTAKVVSIQKTPSKRAASLIKTVEKAGCHLKAKVNTQGVSRNLLVADKHDHLIGVFRNRTITGEAEYRVFLLDADGFFNFPAVVEVTLEIDGVVHQGYLQEFVSPSSPRKVAKAKTPFRQQVQRLGILDLMLANADRHDANILIKHGKLVPIDHNLTLVGTLEGFQLGPFLSQGPEAQQIIPVPRILPVWLSEKRFSQFAQEPFDPETLFYLQHLNTKEMLTTLKATGVSDSRLRLIETLIKWLKQGSAAGLTLEQLGQPAFANYAFDTAIKLARREGPDGLHRISRLEYDLHSAAMIMQEQQIPWDQAVDVVFKERIEIIKDQKQESPTEILFNLIDWSAYPRLNKLHPDNRIIVKALARELADLKTQSDGGLDWRTTSQIYRDYLYLLANTYSNIQAGRESAETGSLFVQFLRTMAKNSDTLMVKGEVWREPILQLMFTLPIEDVQTAVQSAKNRSLAESAFYQESLGQEWEGFATPKFVEQYLRDLKAIK